MRMIFVFLCSLAFVATPALADKTAYEGLFWNLEKTGIFSLSLTGDSIEALAIWGKKSEQPENSENKDKSEAKGPIRIMWGFTYDPNKKSWKDGNIIDPKSGATFGARLSLDKDNQILKMRAYKGTPMFGRTIRFERVKPEDTPDELKQKELEQIVSR